MEKLAEMSLFALAEYEWECLCGKKHALKAHILYGEYAAEFSKVLNKIAPSSKAALLCTRDAFLAEGQKWLEVIRGAGVQPLNVIVAKKFDDALENIGGLFSLPDDVRAIVVFESALYDVASYFSALKNLPAVYVAFSPEAENMLSPVVSLKIKNRTERIYADNEKYVVVDPQAIRGGAPCSEAFASLSSAIVSLIDYRVRGVFTGEYCSESYHLARAAVSSAVNAATAQDAPLKLIEARIRLAAAENYTEGKILRGGENAVAEILESAGKVPLSLAERKFFAALKLIDLYQAFFSLPHGKDMRVPDYVSRAKEVAAITGGNETHILEGILKSAEAVSEERVRETGRQLLSEIDALKNLTGKFAATYRAIGGNAAIFSNYSPQEVRRAVFYAPDIPKTFSVLTLMRESGALEYLL